MIGDWAIDNIVIGNRSLHCPQLCNGHGRCTPSSVCICDEGFSGNNCEEINIIFPNYVQVKIEPQQQYKIAKIYKCVYIHILVVFLCVCKLTFLPLYQPKASTRLAS